MDPTLGEAKWGHRGKTWDCGSEKAGGGGEKERPQEFTLAS